MAPVAVDGEGDDDSDCCFDVGESDALVTVVRGGHSKGLSRRNLVDSLKELNFNFRKSFKY